MSKLIRDLGAGRPYTLTVSTSSAGVELDSGIDGLRYTVTLRSEPEVLDLIRALEAAYEEMRAVTGKPHGASVYAVDPKQDSFVIRTGGGEFFDLSLVAVEKAVDKMREKRPAATGPLRNDRDVSATFGASIAEATDREHGSPPGMVGRAGPTESLNTLRDEARRIAVEHGFTDASIGEDLMLIVTEVAEAMEDHRAGKKPDEVWYEEKINLEDPRVGIALRKTGALVLRHASMMSDAVMDSDQPRRLFKPCGIPSELADVMIRVLHFAGKHGIDIDKAVREKMTYNASRPMKHGGKVL